MKPIPPTKIMTVSTLYKLGYFTPTESTRTSSQCFNNKICLVHGDITQLGVDAIVNAANESLLGGGGVDGAIHRAAGPDLLQECRTLGGCDTGSAKITDAYRLPCKKVIHAVGPIYFKDANPAERLRGCYRKSLELAIQNECKSIAFSAISTGVYGYPSTKAAHTVLEEVRRFLEEDRSDLLEKIVFCSFETKDDIAYRDLIPTFFPPTERDCSMRTSHTETEPAGKETLTDRLPCAPTSSDPTEEGLAEAKKQKVENESGDDEGWEKVDLASDTNTIGPESTTDGEFIEMEKSMERSEEFEQLPNDVQMGDSAISTGTNPPIEGNLLFE